MNAKRTSAYVDAAISAAVALVAGAGAGARNATLAREAWSLGGLAAGEGLAVAEIEAALVNAGVAAGLSEREASYTARAALDKGAHKPRRAPADGQRWARASRPPLPPPRPPPPPADTSHTAEALDVWARSLPPPLGDLAEGVALTDWLEIRGLDAREVGARDLIRHLPEGALPTWCAGWRGRAVLPVYDAEGALVTLRGRLLRQAGEGGPPKTLSPKGQPLAGRLYACPLGRRMLAGEGLPAHGGVLITEGDPDWLTMAAAWPLEEGLAVLGVWSGSMTPAVLARIPDGAAVLLCPHRDETGAGYMRTAAASLLGRCEVWALPYDGHNDVNDSHLAGRLAERLQHTERLS